MAGGARCPAGDHARRIPATQAAVRKNARWQEPMRRRGITDFDMVMINPSVRAIDGA